MTLTARGSGLVLAPDGVANGLLVYFHGAGGDASHSLALVREHAEAYGVAVLMPSSASTTWDLLTGALGPDADPLAEALAELREGVPTVAFGGFSDGASYALSMGLASDVDAVLAHSPGFVAPPSVAGTPRVWISHGDADRVLPVDRCGRRVARTLREAGYDTTYVEFAGGHAVPPDLVDGSLRWWLA